MGAVTGGGGDQAAGSGRRKTSSISRGRPKRRTRCSTLDRCWNACWLASRACKVLSCCVPSGIQSKRVECLKHDSKSWDVGMTMNVWRWWRCNGKMWRAMYLSRRGRLFRCDRGTWCKCGKQHANVCEVCESVFKLCTSPERPRGSTLPRCLRAPLSSTRAPLKGWVAPRTPPPCCGVHHHHHHHHPHAFEA